MKNTTPPFPPHQVRSGNGTVPYRFDQRRTVGLFCKIVLFAGLIAPGGCSWGPISGVSSLSPAVQADSLAYSDAVGDAADRILVSNVLRARDYAPLNLNQLSSVSGALSLQGSLGFSFPFGQGMASKAPVTGQNMVTPSITASTSPTFSLTPLNTQGFTLLILQPVQPGFVLFLAQQGLPREVLLSLLVKEIDLPPDYPGSGGYRYINDPDDQSHFLAFEDLVQQLVAAQVTLKAVDVLESVGPGFNLRTASSESTQKTEYRFPSVDPGQPCKPAQPGAAVPNPNDLCTTVQTTSPDPTQPRGADATGFALVTSSNDGLYHVGNDLNKGFPEVGKQGQLYRAYSGQLIMCVNTPRIGVHHIPRLRISSTGASGFDGIAALGGGALERRRTPADSFEIAMAPLLARFPGTSIMDVSDQAPMIPFAAPSGSSASGNGQSSPSGGGGGSKGGGGGGGSAASGGSSAQATMPTLQASRISAIVYSEACRSDEVVLPEFDERGFAQQSSQFVRVYWRSVAEIFQYLGAILRYKKNSDQPYALAISPDRSVAYMPGTKSSPPASVLFDLLQGGPGSLQVPYQGSEFAVPDIDPSAPRKNYTRPVLAILSTLVNYASQQSAVQTSTPLRLLPLP